MFILAVQTVGVLLTMLVLSIFMCKAKWIDPDKHSDVFGKMVVGVALPAVIFYNMVTQSYDLNAFKWMGVSAITHILSFIISYFLAPKVGVPAQRRGVFAALCSIPNAMVLGFPIATGLYGMDSIPPLTFNFIPSLIFMWTVTVAAIKRDSGKISGKFSLTSLKHLINPSLMTIFAALIVVVLNITLPFFVMESVRYLGMMNTAISMIYIGIILYKSGYKAIRSFDLRSLWILLIKFCVMPVIAALSCALLGVTGLDMKVLVVLAATPSAVMVGVAANTEGADGEYAASHIVMTTVAGMFIMPIIASILG